jgi:tRNA G46 methylase TrmB
MNASLQAPASRPVSSNQAGLHPRLDEVVLRHLHHPWQQPVPAHTRQAFLDLQRLLQPGEEHRLVLDSGCGNGEGSRALAARHPGLLVIGVDQSAHRLARVGAAVQPRREGDLIWVRAELAAFWQLAVAAGWRLQAHYLLYPNPWPKATQLQRRWHAHPVFPLLLTLGGVLELRSNWQDYVQEFARALQLAGRPAPRVEELAAQEPLTPFERKYAGSGHALWRLVTS